MHGGAPPFPFGRIALIGGVVAEINAAGGSIVIHADEGPMRVNASVEDIQTPKEMVVTAAAAWN